MQENESEAAHTIKLLERIDLSYDSFMLLIFRLVQLWHPNDVVELSANSIDVIMPDGRKTNLFLHNLWSEFTRFPEDREDALARYLKVLIIREEPGSASAQDLIAIIRDDAYRACVPVEEQDAVTEHLAGDLWIVYAIDRPTSTTVLRVQDIQSFGIASERLRELGVANVARLLGEIEVVGYESCFSLASQNQLYISSSLLLDDLWQTVQEMVQGDLVVTVSARDTVLFTGSLDGQGLRQLREEAAYVFRRGDHLVSQTLFQRNGGVWKPFL